MWHRPEQVRLADPLKPNRQCCRDAGLRVPSVNPHLRAVFSIAGNLAGAGDQRRAKARCSGNTAVVRNRQIADGFPIYRDHQANIPTDFLVRL